MHKVLCSNSSQQTSFSPQGTQSSSAQRDIRDDLQYPIFPLNLMNRFLGAALWRVLAAVLLLLACGQGPASVRAQNVICATAPLGDSSNRCASTEFVQDAIASPASPATVPHGGTGQTSFTPNLPLIGNGTGPLGQGTRSGNTTSFATTSGALTPNNCPKIDGNGNFVDSGAPCGALAGIVPTTLGGAGANNSTNNSGDMLASNGPNGTFVATALNAVCSLVPSVCAKVTGYVNITWYGERSATASSSPTRTSTSRRPLSASPLAVLRLRLPEVHSRAPQWMAVRLFGFRERGRLRLDTRRQLRLL
ncbi:hypothetical protein ACVWXN_002705 [Bradyrhizobium sp. i1.4.4]